MASGTGADDTPEIDAAAEWGAPGDTVLDGGQLVEPVADDSSGNVHQTARPCAVVRSLMFEKGASNDEVRATVAHVRLRLTKL